MGLFDRLFGKIEEPKIEDVVKEALENIDLSDDSEQTELPVTEDIQTKEPVEDNLPEEDQEEIDNGSSETEVVEEPIIEPVDEVDFSQDEPIQIEEAESHQEELTHVEEVTLSESFEEDADQTQSNETEVEITEELEPETTEEVEEDLAIEETPQVQETEQEKYDRSLKKTRTGFGARLNAFFANFRSVDEDFFEELEELLIMSDVGVQVASNLTEELRYEAKLENAKKPEALRRVIIEKLVELYEKDGIYNENINFQDGLTVMLFVGVNGVGKTTSIGKLANRYKQAGKKVMLVAADTFRAGAVAQLAEWGRRVDVPVVTGPEKADPASVVFDGMERAVAEGIDILMIDTAGRLQNKENLMAELEKIGRIIKRVVPEAPHETFLALDASTGQNALVQAKEFSKITPVTGIVLTKIDGTARGGVVLAIREELNIPVKLIGFGEKIDDIGEFNSENFMKGLLEGLI
nr:signal recognition particle-docking protein FtsY [Streptococcus sp. Marseille-Q6470]